MLLYYTKHPLDNFGDELNEWIWPRLLSRPLSECLDDDTVLLGIGSILNHRVPRRPRKKIVLGSGIGYGSLPAVSRDWSFLCVRGPRSREALGLPADTPLGDSAVLVRELFSPSGGPDIGASFMPHVRTAFHGDWRKLCESVDMNYIDPTGTVEDVTGMIARSRLLVSESLHGTVVADTLRVPWIAVRTSDDVLEIKWHDWAESVGLRHSFVDLPGIAHLHVPRVLKWTTSKGVRLVARIVRQRSARRAMFRWNERWGWTPGAGLEDLRRRLVALRSSGLERLSNGRTFEAMYKGVSGAMRRLREGMEPGPFQGFGALGVDTLPNRD